MNRLDYDDVANSACKAPNAPLRKHNQASSKTIHTSVTLCCCTLNAEAVHLKSNFVQTSKTGTEYALECSLFISHRCSGATSAHAKRCSRLVAGSNRQARRDDHAGPRWVQEQLPRIYVFWLNIGSVRASAYPVRRVDSTTTAMEASIRARRFLPTESRCRMRLRQHVQIRSQVRWQQQARLSTETGPA